MPKEKKCGYTSIGGQAVIEGVMMRGPKENAVAVRKSDGEIVIEKKANRSIFDKYKWLKIPILRGCISFFESMIFGTKALMFSADLVDIEGAEGEQPGKIDAWLEKTFGDKLKDYVIYFSVFLSLILGVGLFMLLPSFLVNVFHLSAANPTLKTVVEGGVRIIIFLIYLIAVSRMRDIQRVFMYHGAEHKTIHCFESGEELTVENVAKQSRLHPRCGTNFLLIVMVVSVFVFMLIPPTSTWVGRVGYRLLLLPIVAGFSYEVIKLVGKYENWLTKCIAAPGMWMQYLTTREPEGDQIEVAIASLQAVLTGDRQQDMK